ncbi:hypothetical protein [Nocardia aurantiaca]|nr:hypothetical protein [Nocardia aurantiaca]
MLTVGAVVDGEAADARRRGHGLGVPVAAALSDDLQYGMAPNLSP